MLNKSITVLKYIFVSLLLLTSITTLTYVIYSEYFENDQTNTENVLEEKEKSLVVLISLDGFGSNLIGEDTPYINSLIQDSKNTYTLDMQTIEQSETLPSHVSMLTGLSQENHGISFNSVEYSTPTLSSYTLFDYVFENGYSYYSFVTKEKLLFLLRGNQGENIKYVDGYINDVGDDIDNLVESEDEDTFVFLHFKDLDSFGHTYGWGSDEQREVLRGIDTYLEILFNDLDQEFPNYKRHYILTADHGGEGNQHSNGCFDCRRIPLIVLNENVEDIYILEERQYNIYDVTCVVLDLIEDTVVRDLDCLRNLESN